MYSSDTLYKLVLDLKSNGKRIGLTHGTFDLFHYSHLDLLQKSSDICDFLIVGVDSDQSVSYYKSYKRPIINEKQRTKIINELDCVDAVFVKNIAFDTETHIKFYKDLMVDIVTIGSRFEFKEEVREEVQQVGAKLIELDIHQDPSTTSIIDSIITRYAQDYSRPVKRIEGKIVK